MQEDKKVITSGEVRTHALKRGPELESGALTTRPQMLAWYKRSSFAGLAQLVERWSHNPKVVSSILTPGNFAWMNSEGSGLGLQIHGGLTSQWFESTFCAFTFENGENRFLQCRRNDRHVGV